MSVQSEVNFDAASELEDDLAILLFEINSKSPERAKDSPRALLAVGLFRSDSVDGDEPSFALEPLLPHGHGDLVLRANVDGLIEFVLELLLLRPGVAILRGFFPARVVFTVQFHVIHDGSFDAASDGENTLDVELEVARRTHSDRMGRGVGVARAGYFGQGGFLDELQGRDYLCG